MDSSPSLLAPQQTLVLPSPSQQFTLLPRTGWRVRAIAALCSPPELATAGTASSPPSSFQMPHTGHQQHPANLQILEKIKPTQRIPRHSGAQAGVYLFFPVPNRGWRAGDELQSYFQGRSCHHQHCRDGPGKRVKPFLPHLRADLIIQLYFHYSCSYIQGRP